MARRLIGRGFKKRSPIVLVLVAVVVGFIVLSSVQEKHGVDFGLPEVEIPTLSWLAQQVGVFKPTEAIVAEQPLQSTDSLEIHIIDVGQANSILIKAPSANVLIDGGENDQGESVVQHLLKNNVDKLDLIIATHPHSDHIGGLDVVMKKIKTAEILMPEIPDDIVPTTRTYSDLLLAIGENQLKLTLAKAGKQYDLGGGGILTVIAPLAQYDDLNNMSVVSRITFGETSFIFSGDASYQSEQDIIASGVNISADVMDIGHHGSKTSSSTDYLDAISPTIAVLSVGANNNYGHPQREILERYIQRNVKILRTDIDGTIILKSNGKEIAYELEK